MRSFTFRHGQSYAVSQYTKVHLDRMSDMVHKSHSDLGTPQPQPVLDNPVSNKHSTSHGDKSIRHSSIWVLKVICSEGCDSEDTSPVSAKKCISTNAVDVATAAIWDKPDCKQLWTSQNGSASCMCSYRADQQRRSHATCPSAEAAGLSQNWQTQVQREPCFVGHRLVTI